VAKSLGIIHSILKYFNLLLELQLPTDTSVRYWAATLGSLVSYQEYFDAECKDGLRNATTTILLKVVNMKIFSEVFGGLGRAINALSWVNQYKSKDMDPSASTEMVSSSIVVASELMDQYVQAVSSTLILQEPSPDFVSETVAS
jgi:hypothetical protein